MEEQQSATAIEQTDTASEMASEKFSSALDSAEGSYGSGGPGSAKAGKSADSNSEASNAKGTGDTGSKSNRERRRENNANAQRRIESGHQRLRDKIDSLEAEINKLKTDGSPASYLEQRSLERQRDTYREIVSSADADRFTDHASETFGDSAPDFMRETYKWSRHVNANEPELRSYVGRPYGIVMLREWYKRMNVPSLMEEWSGMTSYEKGKVLDGFYGQMLEIARKIGQEQHGGGTVPPSRANMPNIPAVSGGRNTDVAGASDDFGIALQSAFNKFGVKR
jgi:hypothetical protein